MWFDAHPIKHYRISRNIGVYVPFDDAKYTYNMYNIQCDSNSRIDMVDRNADVK